MQLPHAALPVDFPARGGPEASYQDKKSGYVRPTGRAQTTANVSTSDKPQRCYHWAPLGRDLVWPPWEAALAREPCATGSTFGGANVPLPFPARTLLSPRLEWSPLRGPQMLCCAWEGRLPRRWTLPSSAAPLLPGETGDLHGGIGKANLSPARPCSG